MTIAIDESGDIGKKFWKGSTKYFVLAAIIVPENDTCGEVCEAVISFMHQHGVNDELHFSHNGHELHVEFFDYMQNQNYLHATLLIDKIQLLKKKPWILRSKKGMYSYALDILFGNIKEHLDNPTIIIDRNGSSHFNKALSRHMYEHFGSDGSTENSAIRKMYSVDSKFEPLIQLADYVAGAVRHHAERGTDNDLYSRYLKQKGKVFFG